MLISQVLIKKRIWQNDPQDQNQSYIREAQSTETDFAIKNFIQKEAVHQLWLTPLIQLIT